MKINIFYFTVAFFIGLLLVNAMAPKPEVVIKYPTPYTSGKQKYVDKSGECFTYSATPTACPSDESVIKTHHIEP